MKTQTSLRLSFLPVLLLPFLASAQQKTTFTINEPVKKSMYGDQRVDQMKYRDLRSIMMATGDDQIARNMRKISGKSAASLTCIVLGNIAMAGGLAFMMSGGEGATGLLAGGAGIMVVGAIAGSGQRGLLRKSMVRYNEVVGDASFTPGTTSMNGRTVVGGTLTLTF